MFVSGRNGKVIEVPHVRSVFPTGTMSRRCSDERSMPSSVRLPVLPFRGLIRLTLKFNSVKSSPGASRWLMSGYRC